MLSSVIKNITSNAPIDLTLNVVQKLQNWALEGTIQSF